MLDHVSLGTANLARARKFYDAALKPLGYKMVLPVPGYGYGYGGAKGDAKFWIGLPLAKRRKPRASAGTHVAFLAENRKSVDAFYKAAIRAGAKDNGKPGLRPEYHANYYGAFVFDPDGNNIEAVCHAPA